MQRRSAVDFWWPQTSSDATRYSNLFTVSARSVLLMLLFALVPVVNVILNLNLTRAKKGSLWSGFREGITRYSGSPTQVKSDRRRCCKRRFITTSLAGIDTSALTHRLMQRCRSVKHPGRSGSGWGTRVSAFQSCTCSVQHLEQCGRRSRRDHSRQCDIDFDVGLPGAVRVGPAATSSHRFACIYDATRGTATRTGAHADRSSLCGDR